MKRRVDVRRLLRWYPASWRARYGDEFLALVEDRLHETPLTMRLRSSIAIAGVRERCYGSGLVGARSTRSTQRRSGSLTVLVAWSIMIVGGASLAKMAEHFAVALPTSSRTTATFAFDMTAVAGIVGTGLVVFGVIVALPGFARLLHAGGWPQVRRTISRSLISSVVLMAATIGLAVWAHQLNSTQRNGGDGLYSAAFVAFAFVAAITIGLWTRTSVAAASRIDFTPRELRWESHFALGVCFSSIVVVVGTSAWWIQMSQHAPWFLDGALTGVSGSPWSARIVVTVLVMAFATATALWGAVRIALTYRPDRARAR
ncbi:MAG TPA: hypothetical protein VMU68_07265 [Acidimicrobiales bacterium]|nr:hypothetical protein [Acidimicrobiales bacterium]